MNWRVDPQAAHTVEGMIMSLAGVCDGAVQHDGQGFSGADTEFGHSLAQRAQQGRPYTVKQAQGALKLVNKYRRQLGGPVVVKNFLEQPVFKMAPLDPLAPKPEAEADAEQPHNNRRLTSQDKLAVFQFPYNAEIVAAVKNIRGTHKGEKFWASWDGANKRWTIPVNESSINPIMQLAERFEFEVEARFTAYLERVNEKLAESRVHLALNEGQHVSLADDEIIISVDNLAILEEFKHVLTT
jgi:hypothetical protein